MKADRRSFLTSSLKTVGLTLSVSSISAILASCEKTESIPTTPGKTFLIDITAYSELTYVGGITIVTVEGLNGSQPVFVSRIAEDAFAVFSNICTHQGCPVGLPTGYGGNCSCPCHFAEYSSINGKVLRQPTVGSAIDLPTFISSYNASENTLTITG